MPELLGTKVRDKITGFEGIATQQWKTLGGDTQYLIEPKVDSDNKPFKGEFITESRLEKIGEGI